jgi:hypothetical protein
VLGVGRDLMLRVDPQDSGLAWSLLPWFSVVRSCWEGPWSEDGLEFSSDDY